MDEYQIPGQMSVEEYIAILDWEEEFAKCMNPPEKEESVD